MSTAKKPPKDQVVESGAAMPFDEALKRVWASPPMHKVKPKPAAKPDDQKAEEVEAHRADKKKLGRFLQAELSEKNKPAK